MKKPLHLATALLVTMTLSGISFAAVTAEEAEQLGKNLTLWGAEKAGNAAGTIPPFTGGLPPTTTVPGWKKGSGRYEQSPYDDEKPLFSITGVNMEKYKANLTAGQIAMLKKYPDYRMDIYPTHRSIGMPDKIASFCKKNAINGKLTKSGDGITGAHSCVPFPIPKNGLEAQWNTQLKPLGGHYINVGFTSYYVDAKGRVTLLSRVGKMDVVNLYQDTSKDKLETPVFQRRMPYFTEPAAQAGEVVLLWVSSDFDALKSPVWFYSPGQRRTRLAPEFSYDGLMAQFNGEVVWDAASGFQGRPDYFNWELVGKKEIYIPYNSNRKVYAPADKVTATKGFTNPDLERWELHRVWVVEMTLKPNKRHVDARRTLYIDEDTWAISLADGYDHAGTLYRVVQQPIFPLWDHQTYYVMEDYINLIKGSYVTLGPHSPDDKMLVKDSKLVNLNKLTTTAMESSGVR